VAKSSGVPEGEKAFRSLGCSMSCSHDRIIKYFPWAEESSSSRCEQNASPVFLASLVGVPRGMIAVKNLGNGAKRCGKTACRTRFLARTHRHRQIVHKFCGRRNQRARAIIAVVVSDSRTSMRPFSATVFFRTICRREITRVVPEGSSAEPW